MTIKDVFPLEMEKSLEVPGLLSIITSTNRVAGSALGNSWRFQGEPGEGGILGAEGAQQRYVYYLVYFYSPFLPQSRSGSNVATHLIPLGWVFFWSFCFFLTLLEGAAGKAGSHISS